MSDNTGYDYDSLEKKYDIYEELQSNPDTERYTEEQRQSVTDNISKDEYRYYNTKNKYEMFQKILETPETDAYTDEQKEAVYKELEMMKEQDEDIEKTIREASAEKLLQLAQGAFESWNLNDTLVIRGAGIFCTFGSHLRRFNLPNSHGVHSKGQPVPHALDNVEGEENNMPSFGVCYSPGHPCEAGLPIPPGMESGKLLLKSQTQDPVTEEKFPFSVPENATKSYQCKGLFIEPWQDAHPNIFIPITNASIAGTLASRKSGTTNALTMNSYLHCTYGGVIMFYHDGQILPSEEQVETTEPTNSADAADAEAVAQKKKNDLLSTPAFALPNNAKEQIENIQSSDYLSVDEKINNIIDVYDLYLYENNKGKFIYYELGKNTQDTLVEKGFNGQERQDAIDRLVLDDTDLKEVTAVMAKDVANVLSSEEGRFNTLFANHSSSTNLDNHICHNLPSYPTINSEKNLHNYSIWDKSATEEFNPNGYFNAHCWSSVAAEKETQFSDVENRLSYLYPNARDSIYSGIDDFNYSMSK